MHANFTGTQSSAKFRDHWRRATKLDWYLSTLNLLMLSSRAEPGGRAGTEEGDVRLAVVIDCC